MIFIWGKTNRILEIYSDKDLVCENCASTDIVYIVNQGYYHLFWIPIFPSLKFVGLYCNDCQRSIEEVYSKTARIYEDQTKTPIYMYSWPIIFLIIIALGIINSLIS